MNKAISPTWRNFFHFALPSMGAMVLFSSYTIIDGKIGRASCRERV